MNTLLLSAVNLAVKRGCVQTDALFVVSAILAYAVISAGAIIAQRRAAMHAALKTP